jgi:uncharacterized membrane protein YkvA (DUF1232 family)
MDEEPAAGRGGVVLVPDDHAQGTAATGSSGDSARAGDGAPGAFPAQRFGALVKRLPRYLRLAWALGGEPTLPRSRRAGVLAAAAYLVSPIDLIPEAIPVVGELDDMAIAFLALRAALRALDEPTRRRVLAEAGLTSIDLDDDIATVGLTVRWLGIRGAQLGLRVLRVGAATAVMAGHAGARLGRAGMRAGARGTAVGTAIAGRGAEVAGRGVEVAGRGVDVAGRGVDAAGARAAVTARSLQSAGRGMREGAARRTSRIRRSAADAGAVASVDAATADLGPDLTDEAAAASDGPATG